MDIAPRITVDGELFLGRLDEQDIFRHALRAVLGPQDEHAPPFVFLLHGEGGMGKSKLTRRLRDVAAREVPFEGCLHVLLLDWEMERSRNLALQMGRDAVRTEAVFDVLHRACVDAGWGRHFRRYQSAVKRRDQAEQEVARALSRETGESRYAAVRDLGAEGLAKLVRLGLPAVGDTGQALAKALLSAGIQVGAEQAFRLRQSADEFLRARLKPQYYDVFRQPNETLACALAEGLRRVGQARPLLLLLDTYEIVARTDPWLRVVIKNAGPRVVWVIAGRHDLAASRPAERFLGYSAEFPRRLTTWDVRELAIDYVLEYLRDRAPERELTRADAGAIHRGTLGVPLAVQAAADLWARGVSLPAIVEGIPDRAPRDEIVRLMTRRLLIHCDDPADRRALYFLAMQRRPDPRALIAVLRPSGAEEQPFDLTARLDVLARCYSYVQLEGGARLHESTGAFVREYLMTTEARVTGDVSDMARRAADSVRARRDQLEAGLPLLEERCASEDWQEATLDLVHWLFWCDERAAWDEAIPRSVEGLGYDIGLGRGLLEVAERVAPALGQDGRARLKRFRAGFDTREPDLEAALLDELERWLERTVPPEDPQNRERRAILHLRRGLLLHRRGQYPDALAALQRSRQDLPVEGEALKRQLGRAFHDLSGKLIWPEGAATSVRCGEGLRAAQAAVELFEENARAHYNLGVALVGFQRHEEALAAFQRAIELDATHAYPHNGLGNVYDDLGRYEKALAAYRRAIELDATYAAPHNGLGNVYYQQGQHGEALAAYRRAIELDATFAYPHNGLGNVSRALGRHEDALVAYRRAIKLDATLAAPHNGLGNAYRALGQHEDAIVAYQRAIELDATLASPHNGLGNVYRALGRPEKALAAYQRAIELNAAFAYPYIGLAGVYRHLGDEQNSQRYLDEARRLTNPGDHTALACLESIAGNVDIALDHLAKALDKAPGYRASARRDPDLAFIRDDPRFRQLVGDPPPPTNLKP